MRPVRTGDELSFDVLVVGAGVAGLVAALTLAEEAPHLRVAVLDKGQIGSSGSTPLAQGGMAAAVGPDDAPALHAADTLRAGDGLGEERAVEILAAEAPARVADLERWGARFDHHPDGGFSLAREGGQTVSRSVRAADATGAEIFRVLREQATGRLTRLQGVAVEPALAAASPLRPVCGVWALLDATDATPTGPAQEGGLALVRARAVLLATGGCGGLYAGTTNRDGATADGVAFAWQAGAELADLEFVQFHPTGLKPRGDGEAFWRLLLTEALRGAGAHLIDRDGRRFMLDRHPDAELAPRHVVAKAILDQPGGAWLDGRRLGEAVWAEEFPTVLAGARGFGFDPITEPLPVEPCEHYMIGGAATDLHGRTTVPGLWAAGEVACPGVHGANRMAGNSLSQSCVFGRRAALSMAAWADQRNEVPGGPATPATPAAPAGPAADVAGPRAELRRVLSRGAGAVRSGVGLDEAAKAIEALAAAPPAPTHRDAIELRNGLLVGGLIVRAASLREESRGVHWREDFPGHDPRWEGARIRFTVTSEPRAGT
jgi:L-aspartate oxidase